jgi:O-antigen/teichoic acid export membrane protein
VESPGIGSIHLISEDRTVRPVERIARNTFALFLSNAFVLALSFIYTMYVARYLGAANYGIISFALAFTGIFGIFTDLGLSQLAVRDIARDKGDVNKYLVNIAAIKLILVVATLLLIAVTVNLMGYDSTSIKVVYVIALSVAASAFTSLLNSIFQAYERLEYTSIGNAINSLALLSGALFSIFRGYDVVGFAFVYLFANLATLAYSIAVLVIEFFRPKLRIDRSFWGPVFKEALPFGLTGVFITIYYWTDSVMLSYMKSYEVVGWYNAAYRLMLILLVVPQVLSISIFPAMSQLYMNSREMLKFTQQRSFKYLALIGFPIGVGTTLLAEEIILLIFGTEYAQAAIALRILVWSSVCIFLSSSFNSLLRSSNRQTALMKITAFCAVENLILNWAAIPAYSYVGASITTVMTEFTALALFALVTFRDGFWEPASLFALISKIALASLLMGGFVFFLKPLSLFLLVPLGAVFYFIVAYLLAVFDEDDKAIIRRALKVKR